VIERSSITTSYDVRLHYIADENPPKVVSTVTKKPESSSSSSDDSDTSSEEESENLVTKSFSGELN